MPNLEEHDFDREDERIRKQQERESNIPIIPEQTEKLRDTTFNIIHPNLWNPRGKG